MGEAKRRRQQQAARAPLDMALVARAVRQTVAAVSDFHGADCILYAGAAAALLQHLGWTDATAVAGEAAWRVGSGDSDVISHSRQGAPVLYAPAARDTGGTVPAAPFHCWVETGTELVDVSTFQLPQKAAELDAADGGHTEVRWAPEFLHVARQQAQKIREVIQAPREGVFAYERRPELEPVVLDASALQEAERLGAAAALVYRALAAGSSITVLGVDERGIVNDDNAVPVNYRRVV